jgi:hypothetical protein
MCYFRKMQQIHNFDKNSSQKTRKMLFRGFQTSLCCAPPPPPPPPHNNSLLTALHIKAGFWWK